jgi:hypothetical protein
MPKRHGSKKDAPPAIDCGVAMVGDHDGSSSSSSSASECGSSYTTSSDEMGSAAVRARKTSSSSYSSASDEEVRGRRARRRAGSKRSAKRSKRAGKRAAAKTKGGAPVGAPAGKGEAAAVAEPMQPSSGVWKTTELTFSTFKSPAELQREGKMELKLDAAASVAIFGSSHTHMLSDIRVLSAKNDLPFTVHAKVAGVESLIKNPESVTTSAAANGTTGHVTVMAGQSLATARTVVEGMHEHVPSRFLESFPGWNASNIFKDGITHIPGTPHTIVRDGHPVIEYFRKALGAAFPKNDVYQLSTERVNFYLDKLKRNIEATIPFDDLHGLTIEVTRALGAPAADTGKVDWDDPEELMDGVATEAGRADVLEEKRRFSITLQVKARPF